MMSMHATARCRQRGIQGEVLDVLLAYGRVAHRGGEIFFMDRKAHARAQAELGRETYSRLADRLGAYVVVSDDGVVITAAKRIRRLKF